MKIFFYLVVLVFVSSVASAEVIYDVQNGELMGVSGIELYGTEYNVEFGHSCLTLYGDCDQDSFMFTTAQESVDALTALYGQALNDDVVINGEEYDFDSDTSLLYSIERVDFAEIWVPYSISPQDSRVVSVWGTHRGALNDWQIRSTDWTGPSDYGYGSWNGIPQPGDRDYMVFTKWEEAAPVPEPSTFLLLGSGLAGLGFYARKRKNV